MPGRPALVRIAVQPAHDLETTAMGRLTKPFCAMLLAQAACLAAGLWIHDRYSAWSERWAVESKVWEQLSEATKPVAAKLATLRAEDVASDPAADVDTPAPWNATSGTGVVVLVVDPNWRVLQATQPAGARVREPGSWWHHGGLVEWKESSIQHRQSAERKYGVLKTPEGPRFALNYPLSGSSGHALFYDRVTDAAPVRQMMSPAAGLALLWTMGVQSIVAYLILSRASLEASKREMKSDEMALRRSQDLIRTRDAVIFGLAKLAESRDQDTGQHLERIAAFSTRLTAELRRHPKYRDLVTPSFVRLIGISSALHDIGKVGIEDSILLKPGRLTQAERARMNEHSMIGGECLQQIERRLATSNFLEMAREIALYHHERWDGTGYPKGLSGEQIPLSARIVAIVDVYDALSVNRVYKSAFPHEKCVEIIRREAGKQFDPDLVAVFLTLESQFREISARFADAPRARAHTTQATPAAEFVEHTLSSVLSGQSMEEMQVRSPETIDSPV